MARLLFIVNDHPNEAFAISSAWDAAMELQGQGFRLFVLGKDEIPEKAKGNEIIIAKVSPKETLLGRAQRGLPVTRGKNSMGKNAAWFWTHTVPIERAQRLAMQRNADITYSFHCTEAEGIISDFAFLEWYPSKKKQRRIPLRLVEIKAHYKRMPGNPLGKIKDPWYHRDFGNASLGHYLQETTSHPLTIAAGLTPEGYGKAIAEQIQKDVELHKRGKKLEPLFGSIPRAFRPLGKKIIHRKFEPKPK